MPIRAALAALALLAAAPAAAGLLSGLTSGPAIEVMPPAGSPRATVIYLSGDAGWGPSLGRRAALALVAGGDMVVGLDCLRFFSDARTPAEAAAWIAAATRAPGVPQGGPLILMGQSFGADALVGAATLLPPALLRRVAGVGLIVPGPERFDKVSLGEFLGTSRGADNRAAAHALAARFPLLCLRGADETDSLCPELKGPTVRQAVLPGGHMLKRDADALGHALAAWTREVGAREMGAREMGAREVASGGGAG